MITKSLAGVAAGALLVGGAAVATAQADPFSPVTVPVAQPTDTTTPSALVGAPSDTSGYPGSVVTTTGVNLPRSVQYGAAHQARVVVDATAAQDVPDGSVTVTVAGVSRQDTLSGGSATVSLPRSLKPGRFTARARYSPASDSQFKASSGSAAFTVVKAGSRTLVQAFRVSRDERPTVRISVESTTGVTPRGSVFVVITDGRQRQARQANLINGQTVVGFPKVDRPGQWDARAVYGGSDVVSESRGTDTFRVTR